MFEKVQQIISDVTSIEKENIKPMSLLYEDLNIDSLDLCEITIRIEEKFNIDIDGYDLKNIICVNDIVSILNGNDESVG